MRPRKIEFPFAIRAGAMLAMATLCVAPVSAATVRTYNFSGTFDFSDPNVTGIDPPLSDADYLPQLAGATSFTGNLTYSYSNGSLPVDGWGGGIPGASVEHVEIEFPGGYVLSRTNPSLVSQIYSDSFGDYASFELGNFGQPGAPPIGFQSDVLLENIGLIAYFDPPPAALDAFDLTAPEISSLNLFVRVLKEDPENEGSYLSIGNQFPISSIALVPEPSALVLAGMAAIGLLGIARRTKIVRRRRLLPLLVLGGGLCFSNSNPATATIYTFDNSAALTDHFALDVIDGDTGTLWQPAYPAQGGFPGSSGGIVTFDQYDTGNSLAFATGPVVLHSFQISSQASNGGYGVGDANLALGDYRLKLFDEELNTLYDQILTVAPAGVWGTVTLNVPNVWAIWIDRRDNDGTGTGGWWPNLDNIRVNEVPEPNGLALAGIAMIGLMGLARRRSVAVSLREINLMPQREPSAKTTLPLVCGIALAAATNSAQAALLPVYGGPTYSTTTMTGFTNPALSESEMVTNGGMAVGTAEKVDSGVAVGLRAVRWDGSGESAVELDNVGTNASGFTVTFATSISGTGIAVGIAQKFDADNFMGNYAVRWSSSGTSVSELDALGTDNSGFTDNNVPMDVNSSGTAVGYGGKYDAGTPKGTRAVRWDGSGTAVTELDHLGTDAGGTTNSLAFAVNDSGTAVGYAYYYLAGVNSGFIAVRWDGSGTAATALDDLGTGTGGVRFSDAKAINEVGTAVGRAAKYVTGTYKGTRAARWDASGISITELDHLGTDPSGFTENWANDVNVVGAVVGIAKKYITGLDKGYRGVRWDASGTSVTELGNLGTDANDVTQVLALDLNDNGDAVGIAQKWTAGVFDGNRAVLWRSDALAVDLNTLIDPASGWLLMTAYDISNTGWIVGLGEFDPDGPGGDDAYQRMFLLNINPVPEPSTWALASLASVGLYGWRRRQQRKRRRGDTGKRFQPPRHQAHQG